MCRGETIVFNVNICPVSLKPSCGVGTIILARWRVCMCAMWTELFDRRSLHIYIYIFDCRSTPSIEVEVELAGEPSVRDENFAVE